MDFGMLMVVHVAAAMFTDMITCNRTKTNKTSEGFNIWIWKLELNL